MKKSVTESGLMKLTKKELVNVILRKDDVEKKLKNEVKNIEDRYNNLKKDYKSKEDMSSVLNKYIKENILYKRTLCVVLVVAAVEAIKILFG